MKCHELVTQVALPGEPILWVCEAERTLADHSHSKATAYLRPLRDGEAVVRQDGVWRLDLPGHNLIEDNGRYVCDCCSMSDCECLKGE